MLDASFDKLKAKVAAADDEEEMQYFIKRAAADSEQQSELIAEIIQRLLIDDCISSEQASKLAASIAAPQQSISSGQEEKPSPPPVLMVAEPPPMAAFVAKAVAISSAHRVECRLMLRDFLVEKALDELVAELDLQLDDAALPKQWFAEHARAQLTLDSGCDSRPAWLARLDEEETPPAPADAAVASGGSAAGRRLSMWAVDGAAARRALLALHLERGALSVAVRLWGLLPSAAEAQLQRWAYEREDYELVAAVAASAEPAAAAAPSAGGGVFTATLRPVRGSEREAQQQRRHEGSAADLALARAIVDALAAQLRQADAKASMHVAPGKQPGTLVITRLTLRGHLMECAIDVDKHASVDALEKLATVSSCVCCAGDDNPWPEPKRRGASGA